MELCQHCNRTHMTLKDFEGEEICLGCWDDIAIAAIKKMIREEPHD